jgi:hypothetical protein
LAYALGYAFSVDLRSPLPSLAILGRDARFLLGICDDVDPGRAFIELRVVKGAGSYGDIVFSQGEDSARQDV